MIGVRLALSMALLLGGLFSPLTAEAQQAATVLRRGYLELNRTDANPRLSSAFREGLRSFGYVEGRNVVIEYRSAEGKPERLSALAAELVALKVEVILIGPGTLRALAAQQATKTVPIVFTSAGDPVTSGLVSSLARPGGNVTGLSLLFPELVGKCLEHLKQVVPRVGRIAVLWQPGAVPERAAQYILKEADAAARALGVQLQRERSPAEGSLAGRQVNGITT
jgi:putative ABC transport system substrate-binding protein